nr:septum formation initiator family protein [Desulfobaculum xiamenense]
MLLVLNAFLGYRLLASDQGVFAYVKLREECGRMQDRLAEADRRARDLSREIRLLQFDRDYLKDTIRKRMNYLAQDEVVYVFPDAKTDSTDPHAGAATNANQD